MLGLTCLEVYTFIFNIPEEKNKIEPSTDTFFKFSFEQLKDELEKIGPHIIQAYNILGSEKSSTGG